MTRRQRRTTPSAGKLTFTTNHVAVQTDERVAPWPDETVFPVYHASHLCGVQDLACDRWISGDRFDPVDGRSQIQFLVFQMCKQLHPEFDPVGYRVSAHLLVCLVVAGHTRPFGRGPQSV